MISKKIVAPIPVHGRASLLSLTIKRLYEKNGVHKVICIGDDPKLKTLCESLGAEWVEHKNKPLGAKWNAGFQACEKYNPDGVLFVGSSDWISDQYLSDVAEYLDNYAMIGMLGCHFIDCKFHSPVQLVDQIRGVFWPGYGKGERQNEPIGIGRVLSSEILKKIDWKPFYNNQDSSLDWTMFCKVVNHNGKIGIFPNDEHLFLSISTNLWENKHKFEDHWNNKIPSKKINSNDINSIIKKFPEITHI